MGISVVDLKQIEQEAKGLSDKDIIEKYKLRCCIGRTAPLGEQKNSKLFTNGDYINIIVREIKSRKLQNHLLGYDL